MTSNEFILWLKGFVAGSSKYNLTPKGWDEVKDKLNEVDNYNKTITISSGYSSNTNNTANINITSKEVPTTNTTK